MFILLKFIIVYNWLFLRFLVFVLYLNYKFNLKFIYFSIVWIKNISIVGGRDRYVRG